MSLNDIILHLSFVGGAVYSPAITDFTFMVKVLSLDYIYQYTVVM